jgi:uncharacterized SAM-binding protein YcdF (DUF218 family)
LTQRLPAGILVVEGWIGRDGVRAAEGEFEEHGYQYIVVAGGATSEGWEEPPSSYAGMAERELIRLGIPNHIIIVAPSGDTERQRTYESAVAVLRVLQAKGIHPRAVNVFTKGSHARRSRLVFSKAFGPGIGVGVVSWTPSDSAALPWWQSSDRAKDLLTETVGYLFEALLNSGRGSNPPRKAATPDFVANSY